MQDEVLFFFSLLLTHNLYLSSQQRRGHPGDQTPDCVGGENVFDGTVEQYAHPRREFIVPLPQQVVKMDSREGLQAESSVGHIDCLSIQPLCRVPKAVGVSPVTLQQRGYLQLMWPLEKMPLLQILRPDDVAA